MNHNTLNCTTMDGNKCDISQTGLHLHHRLVSINEAFSWLLRRRSVLPHSCSKWLKPAKNKLTEENVRVFTSKLQQIHIFSVSCHCMLFIFKICQSVAGRSITTHFHEFYESHFWRSFCYLEPLCVPRRAAAIELQRVKLAAHTYDNLWSIFSFLCTWRCI